MNLCSTVVSVYQFGKNRNIMLKITDAPKNKNVENTCIYNISGRTKQYVIYAS